MLFRSHVLQRSWGSSRMLDRNAPRIIAGDFGPSASPVRNLVKDLSIIAALGSEKGLRLSAASEAQHAFSRLLADGKGEWDIAAAALLVEQGKPR